MYNEVKIMTKKKMGNNLSIVLSWKEYGYMLTVWHFMCTHQRLTYGRGEQQTIKKSNRILIIGLIRNKKKIKCVKNDEISLFLSLKKKSN